MFNKGTISWGAIITALLLYSKLKKEKQKYLRNQRIERKLDYLIELEGGEWAADSLTVTTKSLAKKKEMWFISLWQDYITARSVKKYTNLPMGRKINVKSKLASRKLWMAVVSAVLVVANEGLDLGIDTNTVLAFAGIIMSYIFGQAYVDGKQGGSANESNFAKIDQTGE